MKAGRIREAIRSAARAGAESMWGVTFLHGEGSLTAIANAWLRGSEAGDTGIALDRPYTQHPTINQAVSVVAADFASVEWEAYPKRGTARTRSTPIDGHPVLEWFERPAPGLTRRELMEASGIFYLLDGEAIWNYPDVVINPRGTPVTSRLDGRGLELIAPATVEWDVVAGRAPILRRNRNREPLDLETLTIFRAFNPYGLRGVGKIEPLRRDARADLGASRWNEWQLADRNGLPAMVLKPPAVGSGPTGTPKSREEVRERWESSFPTSRRGIGVTPPGWDVEELGSTRKDMEWVGMRGWARELVLGGVGLVPFLAGVLDKANYANAREQKFVYWRGTQTRLLSVFEDKINNDVLPKVGVDDVRLLPKWSAVRAAAEDVEMKSATAKTWHDMGLSKKVINETLEMGWDPDDVEDYEVGYLPVNLVPASDLATLGLGATVDEPADDEQVDDEQADDAVEPTDDDGKKPKKKARFRAVETAAAREARRLSLWRLHVVRLRVLEAPVESILRSWLHGLETAVLARLRSLAGLRLVESSRRELARSVGAAAVETAVGPVDVDSILYDLREATNLLVSRMTPRIKAALVSGGEDVIDDAGLKVPFNPNDFRLAAKLVEGQLKVRGISSTVREALRDELLEGMRLGESSGELADRITDVMGAAKARATTIARTEMGISYSSGRYVGMRQASITKHEWLSARDDRVREDHARGTGDDGVVVDVGTPFPHSGLLYPLDPAGPPEQVINCRCTTIPVVTED
jgi:SPP1 gp7 family putative phage head morphogenesis protein